MQLGRTQSRFEESRIDRRRLGLNFESYEHPPPLIRVLHDLLIITAGFSGQGDDILRNQVCFAMLYHHRS